MVVQEGTEMPKEPRLFQLSNATGQVKVDEVFDFAQVRTTGKAGSCHVPISCIGGCWLGRAAAGSGG